MFAQLFRCDYVFENHKIISVEVTETVTVHCQLTLNIQYYVTSFVT